MAVNKDRPGQEPDVYPECESHASWDSLCQDLSGSELDCVEFFDGIVGEMDECADSTARRLMACVINDGNQDLVDGDNNIDWDNIKSRLCEFVLYNAEQCVEDTYGVPDPRNILDSVNEMLEDISNECHVGKDRIFPPDLIPGLAVVAYYHARYAALACSDLKSRHDMILLHDIWEEILQDIIEPDGHGVRHIMAICKEYQEKAGVEITGKDEWADFTDMIYYLSHAWKNQKQARGIDILSWAVRNMEVSYDLIDALAWGMTKCTRLRNLNWDKSYENNSAGESPSEIYDYIDGYVYGQDDAKRAAAMVMWHNLHGRRENIIIAGPSGCGKSEIWRALAKRWPERIKIIDASRLSADGWKGSTHVIDFFDGVLDCDLADRGLIIVLDEADKLFCESAIGSGGTDYNAMVQTNVLKIMDGDVIDFNPNDGKAAYHADCSKVSVVLLGTFERLLANRNKSEKSMGFGGKLASNTPDVDAGRDITFEDLIKAGMRREVAGRVNKIVMLNALSQNDYMTILNRHVLPGLSKQLNLQVSMDGDCESELIQKAYDKKLGVRWIKSRTLELMDRVLFDRPDLEEYEIKSMD